MTSNWTREAARTDPEALPEIDTTRPSVARMYDYYLGGKDNYAVDRGAVDRVEAAMPEIRTLAEENRAFLRRAVRYMVDQGIRQFIDIGAGLPTAGNTHEVAQESVPDARVVYVDNDPIVLAHGRALLATNASTTVITADMRRPADVLDHPETRRMLDLDQPVGVLLIAMPHFLLHEERPEIIGALHDRLAPGSLLSLTHVTGDEQPADAVAKIEKVYAETPTPIFSRPRDEVALFFDGFDLVDPGLVTIDEWRPAPGDAVQEAGRWLYGGVGRKP